MKENILRDSLKPPLLQVICKTHRTHLFSDMYIYSYIRELYTTKPVLKGSPVRSLRHGHDALRMQDGRPAYLPVQDER